MEEDNCIGVGFWVEGFGTVDMYCYVNENIKLTEEKKQYVRKRAVQTMNALFKVMENPELMEKKHD